MTYQEALKELESLLLAERDALIGVHLDAVIALGGRKAELLGAIETPLEPGEKLDAEDTAAVLRVREAADRNWFLIRHLRGCFTVAGVEGASLPTYGRDGRAHSGAVVGTTRARL